MIISFFRKEKGQALIEFAFILPILLLLIFGIVEFGRIYSAGLTVNQGAREGARMGSLRYSDAEIIDAVQNAAPTLDPGKLSVVITPQPSERKPGSPIQVDVKYPVQVIAPFISAITGETVNVGGVSVMRIE